MRNRVRRLTLPALLSLLAALPVQAQKPPGLDLQVKESARSVDLSRGKEEFLTLTVDVTAPDAARLRRLQPLRDDFQLLAGGNKLACRWLRGGSLPDDPRRLRFTLGFTLPPKKVRKVSLIARLPRLDEDPVLELRLTGLQPGRQAQERGGPGWTVTVRRFEEEAYEVPALPAAGHFISKAGPVDARVFRTGELAGKVPAQVYVLAFRSRTTALYDMTVDVSGTLQVEGGPGLPLISATMRRDPSRVVEKPIYGPFVDGEFHFPVPAKGRATGALLTFHRRIAQPSERVIRRDEIPVPGR